MDIEQITKRAKVIVPPSPQTFQPPRSLLLGCITDSLHPGDPHDFVGRRLAEKLLRRVVNSQHASAFSIRSAN